MIGHLRGNVRYQDIDFIILETHGVGYKVFVVSSPTLGDEAVELWIYTAVRETALDLYGFNTREELILFELLLTVSGVGPKSALGIMAAASVNDLKQAALQNDPALLTKVNGIGKKTAQKIVVELRDKLEAIETTAPVSGGNSEAIDALLALGYTREEARDALQSLDVEGSTSEIVRAALKQLGS